MNLKEYAQQIIDDLLTLPEEKIGEVIDFVQFLKLQVKHKGSLLRETGLTQEESADLRARLATFENDWNAPGMEAYDDL